MIVSDNKMQCWVKWADVGGGEITTGKGAKGVSNLLMEAVAGRNTSMTNTHTHAGECKPLSPNVYSSERGRDKERSGGASS